MFKCNWTFSRERSMKLKEIEVLGERKEMKNAKMFDETGQTQHSLSLFCCRSKYS